MTPEEDIRAVVADLQAGKMVIVTDDKGRENEGDFIMLAQKTTPEDINFMSREGRGLICVPLTPDRARRLGLDPMVSRNTSLHETAFTVSVDAVQGTSTGISAKDRWRTLQVILDPASSASDLGRPGHMFPLLAKRNGTSLVILNREPTALDGYADLVLNCDIGPTLGDAVGVI